MRGYKIIYSKLVFLSINRAVFVTKHVTVACNETMLSRTTYFKVVKIGEVAPNVNN